MPPQQVLAHSVDPSGVVATLATHADRGLSSGEAAERLSRHGRNRPAPESRPHYVRLAAGQLVDPLVGLLIAAAAVSAAIDATLEAGVILAIVVLNAILGFWQEAGAERAIRALTEAFSHEARVVRDAVEQTIPADEVVPGDVLVVREGDRVAADARVLRSSALEVDESALTGESLPVEKLADPVPRGAPLAERSSMLHAGTGITRGHGRAVVCATGASTELGQIAALTSQAPPPPTPLTRRFAKLGRQLVVVGLGIAIVLTGAMLLRGEHLHTAFLTGVAVAVAAVPEGLAATVTAALALGARAMARRGAIIRRLAAIETLGETSVICTDKTGTLTENRIGVAELLPAPGFDERSLLEAAVRASAAHPSGDGLVGDPVETALLRALMERSHGESPNGSDALLFEIPFDAARKRMTRVWREVDGVRAYTKGAPEVVAALADSPAHPLLDAAAERAAQGLRVLAVSVRSPGPDVPLGEQVELGGELAGIVALRDPLRETTADAVTAARQAGIEVQMVTGDHPATAHTIGRELGLPAHSIHARTSPADKLELVERLQSEGKVVAATGDGVNDAPALRRADVGIAMGATGTEAAREAASIVLTDDDFATIVAAVAEGRRIRDNISKFVAFLLSANFGEVIAFAVAIAAGLGVPLAVVQVLVINLVTDGLPAVALAQDPPDPGTMRSPPRSSELLAGGARRLAAIGLAVGAVTLIAFEIGHALGGGVAQTMAFATLSLSELALVFAFRSADRPFWRLPPNRWLSGGVLLSAIVVAVTVYAPFAHDAASTVSLPVDAALIALGLAVVPLVLAELAKLLSRSLDHA